MQWRRNAVAAVGMLLVASSAGAQEITGFRADVLKDIASIEAKYVALAEAMPASSMTWRPGEGVRSVSEVLMHVTGANYMLTNFIGIPAPATAPPRDAETGWTDQARIVPALKASFAHLRSAIEKTPDAKLDEMIRMFGSERSIRAALLLMDNHLHEHLGQMIAYARTNNVTPPWSAGE